AWVARPGACRKTGRLQWLIACPQSTGRRAAHKSTSHPLASPPRPFHNPPMSLVNDITSFAATAVRLGRGVFPRVTAAVRPDPPKRLWLYDFEGCPYCRKVREVLSELDLDYLEHPVARASPRRAELVKRGGKMQAPYLVDPNTRTEMYESDDIIAYLNATYGAGARAGWRLPVPRGLDDVDSMLASAVRLGRGARCRRTRELSGVLPLILYNMEGSPYCRKVLEHGDLPPYDVLRKMMKAFGLDEMARIRFQKQIEREKAAARGAAPKKPREERSAEDIGMRLIPIIELCHYCPGMVTALGVSVGLTAAAIMSKGTIAQKERWGLPLLTLEKIGAWAITEPGSGSDAFGGMKSTARRDGDGYVLNGSKTFITNGPYADTTVFICKLDDGAEPRNRKVLSFI